MTLMMIDRKLHVTPPETMAIAYADEMVVGWAGVATIYSKDEWMLGYYAADPEKLTGWLNVYVLERWRKKEVGKRLLDTAFKAFRGGVVSPDIHDVILCRTLQDRFPGYTGIDPVFASIGFGSFRLTAGKRYAVTARTPCPLNRLIREDPRFY